MVDCIVVDDGGGLPCRRCVGGDLLRWLRLLALGIGDGLRCLGLQDLERRGLDWLRLVIVQWLRRRVVRGAGRYGYLRCCASMQSSALCCSKPS